MGEPITVLVAVQKAGNETCNREQPVKAKSHSVLPIKRR
jgi:hypothetical protein